MKFLMVLFFVCLSFSVSVFAQSKINFTGEWILNLDKSEFSDALRIESMNVVVVQSESSIKVTTDTKNINIPGRRGMPKRGPSTTTYTLGGKETTSEESDFSGNKILLKLKADLTSDGTLRLSKMFESQGGKTIKETWSLSDAGKTLTIKRESSTKNDNAEFVFTKKQ